MSFKFNLSQIVSVSVSGEVGHIKSRSDSVTHSNQYLIHYKAADGRAVDAWFDEQDLIAAE